MATKKPDYADELEHWLRFDNWYPDQAFALFCEDDPNKAGTGLVVAQFDFDSAAARQRKSQLLDIWWSNNDPDRPEPFPPSHFIEWATRKNIEIPWLTWAKQKRLIHQHYQSDQGTSEKSHFNKKSTLGETNSGVSQEEIRGATFAKCRKAIEEFKKQYPAFPSQTPKLDDDVRPWLRKSIQCNDREAEVFGRILAEHFNLQAKSGK